MAGYLWMMILCQCLAVGWSSIECRDNKNNAVDWFIVYKLPRLKDSKHGFVRSGVGQMYMDVNRQQWTLLEQPINDTNHAVYHTLQQIYSHSNKQQSIAYLLYNDETPEKKSFTHGHTKGDVAFDKSSGFWLVHSVPKFPPEVSEGYSYPHSGTIYGQTFLCVTYAYEAFNVIGKQLWYNYPQIYGHNLPSEFHGDIFVSKVINGSHVTDAPWNKSVVLHSRDNQQFVSFAKFTNYGQDLYDAWIAPHFASDLKVETWQNGVGPLPSNCSTKHKVLNVKQLNISSEFFKETEDHAKWAVTASSDWICIGDINRDDSQKERAGGTVCSNLPHVSEAFKHSIVQVEPCRKDRY